MFLSISNFFRAPSGIEIARTCFECHDDIKQKLGEPNVHVPAKQFRCTSCHKPHGKEIVYKEIPFVSLVSRYKLETALDRPPYGSADGEDKLVVTSTTIYVATDKKKRPGGKSALIGAVPDMCFKCHPDNKAQMEFASVMPPYKAGGCMNCHDPHGSQNKSFTKDPVPKLCFGCHDFMNVSGMGSMSELREKPYQMPPFKAGQCMTCHFPHASQSIRLLRQDVPNLCFSCHDFLNVSGMGNMADLRKKPYQMPPFAGGQCLMCHYPHGTDNPRLLRNKVPDLCWSCHDALKTGSYDGQARVMTSKDWRSLPVQMKPYRDGYCISCHYPHGTDYPRLLRNKVPNLCFWCHDYIEIGPNKENLANYRGYKVQMKPFKEGKCLSCHYYHASPNKRLLQKPVPDLCFSCHDEIPLGVNGETTATYRKMTYQMKPFKEGKCFNCHYHAHGSPNRRLLKLSLNNNDLCLSCHAEGTTGSQDSTLKVKADVYKTIKHSQVVRVTSPYQPEAGRGSCLNCHVNHASNNFRLLQKEQISLCRECHKKRTYYQHPVGATWTDPWRGNYLRCGSCHNPMGSGYERLKRKPKDGLCASCHDASNPIYLYYTIFNGKQVKVNVTDAERATIP